MNYAHFIKELGRGSEGARDMSMEEAQQLYGAMLDGGVPDLELGAIAIALRMKGETTDEMIGFLNATYERVHGIRPPAGRLRPVVIPSYNGARKGANLTPLLALLLQRFGIPVLVHGLLEGYGRVTSAHIFRELGIMPCTSHNAVQQAMDGFGVAFVPLSVISPGLNNQLALRGRLGLRNSAHSLVKLLDPFKGGGVLLAAAGWYVTETLRRRLHTSTAAWISLPASVISAAWRCRTMRRTRRERRRRGCVRGPGTGSDPRSCPSSRTDPDSPAP